MAIIAVLTLLWVGRGLHRADSAGVPSLLSAAQAEQPASARTKPFVWEVISSEGNSTEYDVRTRRAKVPGGWLVEQIEVRSKSIGAGITFYPDADHRWDGSTLPAAPGRRN
jgi:hypothetical protein